MKGDKRKTSSIANLDLVGPDFTFEYDNSNRFLSKQGGYLTILFFILLCIISFFLIKDVFFRQTPLINYYYENNEKYKVPIVNIPLIFKFMNTTSEQALDIDYIISKFSFNFYSEESLSNIPLVTCNHNAYNAEINLAISNVVESINSTDILCFDNIILNEPHFLIEKDYIEDEDHQFEMSIDLKDASVDLNEIKVNIYYYTTSLQLTNISSPFKSKMRNLSVFLNNNQKKSIFIYYQNMTIMTDNDFFINTNNPEVHYLINMKEIIPYSEVKQDNNVFSLILAANTKVEIFKRSFQKLFDSLALVGGLANALLITMRLLFQPYLRYLYFLFLKETTFNFCQSNIVKSSPLTFINVGKEVKMNKINSSKFTLVQGKNSENVNRLQKIKEELPEIPENKSHPIKEGDKRFSRLLADLQFQLIREDLNVPYVIYLLSCFMKKTKFKRIKKQEELISEVLSIKNFVNASLLSLKIDYEKLNK